MEKQDVTDLVNFARNGGISLDELKRLVSREYVTDALRDNRVNVCRTANEMGIHRNTLSRQIGELEIDMSHLKAERDRKLPRSVNSLRAHDVKRTA